jgi:hypothetical protein
MIMESKKMFVDDFDGEIIVNSEYELIKILKKRPAFDSNYYIFTFSENGFPQLASFVKNKYCIIYYLENGKTLISKDNNNKDNGIETFYENKNGSKIELAKENIINIEKMEEIILEYYKTKECPKCITWDKL